MLYNNSLCNSIAVLLHIFRGVVIAKSLTSLRFIQCMFCCWQCLGMGQSPLKGVCWIRLWFCYSAAWCSLDRSQVHPSLPSVNHTFLMLEVSVDRRLQLQAHWWLYDIWRDVIGCFFSHASWRVSVIDHSPEAHHLEGHNGMPVEWHDKESKWGQMPLNTSPNKTQVLVRVRLGTWDLK